MLCFLNDADHLLLWPPGHFPKAKLKLFTQQHWEQNRCQLIHSQKPRLKQRLDSALASELWLLRSRRLPRVLYENIILNWVLNMKEYFPLINSHPGLVSSQKEKLSSFKWPFYPSFRALWMEPSWRKSVAHFC